MIVVSVPSPLPSSTAMLPLVVALTTVLAVGDATGFATDRADGVGEIRRFATAEAHQGVAVDATHFYAIDSAAIGRYDKATGERVARWTETSEGAIRHLNGGVVIDGRLYCAHSNYPAAPPESTVEIFDPATLHHERSIHLESAAGWLTWVDRHAGTWWGVFAHYEKTTRAPAAPDGNRPTTLVRFDPAWRPAQRWSFPSAVLARFGAYSNSGGAFDGDGRLWATGHDRREAYVLALPPDHGELRLTRTVVVPSPGQGIAWDRSRPGVLYAIDRPTRAVLVLRVAVGSY
jgi:outer membrane protein assembly factor BamB